jgi:hypothetical protein
VVAAAGVAVEAGVAVAVGVAVGVAVEAGVAVAVGVGSDAVVMQADALMVSLMRVTSPVPANTRPSTVTPEPRVIEVDAMTVPMKVEPSSVAELPTCQNTLHGEAPSVSTTLLLVEVTRLDPVWKMNTPAPVKVSVPFRLSAPSEVVWYTPGVQGEPGEVGRLRGARRALPRRLVVRRGQIGLGPERDAIGGEGGVGRLDDARWEAGDRRSGVGAQVPGDGRGAGIGDTGARQDREGRGRTQIHRGCCQNSQPTKGHQDGGGSHSQGRPNPTGQPARV